MGLTTLGILGFLCWYKVLASTCLYNQTNISGICTNCASLYPACNACDSSGCTSCDEGLYAVVDKKVCVERCDLVIIPSTDTDQSRYFADTFNRMCYRCGPDCAKCLDNVGCVNIIKDETSTDAMSSLVTVGTTGFQVSSSCFSILNNCKRCSNNSTCTLCEFSQLANGSCGTKCTDSNCKFCDNNSCCQTCSDGYILNNCKCISLGCAAKNCAYCTSPTSSTCSKCNKGYYINSSGVCVSCILNCSSCTSNNTCDVCDAGFALSSDGISCVKTCSINEYLSVSSLSPYIFGLTEKRKCMICNITCSNCPNSNLAQNCLQCFKEKCTNKIVSPDNNTIIIIVSNLNSDIDKKNNGTLDKYQNVFVDFMAAWNRAEELASTYSTKQNGSVLTIQILFTKGIHYILNINTFDKTAVIDSSNSAYEIKISPYYCSLLSSMSSNSICTLDTEVVTIYNKLGYKFNLKIPQKLTIENIIFDMIEGIIPWINDPSSVLTKRINACQYNNSTKKMVNNTSSESCSLRNTLTDSCARSPKYHMFTFMNNNSSSSLPFKFIMTNVTILNVFNAV